MYSLPSLPYNYNDLEPYIDEETMRLHHLKHHQTYVDKLNQALEGRGDLTEMTVEELLTGLRSLPEEIKESVRRHGGGHFNHSFFWKIMTPDSDKKEPGQDLLEVLEKNFGSYKEFRSEFIAAALGVFGSGWAWLVSDSEGKLSIVTTANQDCPLSDGLKPVLGVDVWEHAYYLKHQNRRPEYLEAWFEVINWVQVNDIWQGLQY